jgi:hypothetical protein
MGIRSMSAGRLAVAAALALAGAAAAADSAEFSLIGFSRGGGHVAWEQYGVQDGSGFPWASLYVESAVSGRTALGDTLVLNIYEEGWPEDWFDEDLDLVGLLRDSLLARHGAEMERMGIVPGEEGAPLIVRLPTDLSRYESTEFVREWYAPGYSRGPRYRLELQSDSVGTEMMYRQPLVALKLVLQAAGREVVLADDGGEGAPVAYSYGVSAVHMYGDSTIAVLLSRMMPGFEGANSRWRVVAAVLPEDLRP